MFGKTPATEEQGCEAQTEYYQMFWLLHLWREKEVTSEAWKEHPVY